MSDARLIDALCTTPGLAEVFSDQSVIAAMLEFETALAVVEARAGIIPASAAEAIAAAAADERGFDMPSMLRETRRSATPSIPLVAALTDRVRAGDAAAAGYVHWGATSQDVADTAIVLLLRRARSILEDHVSTIAMTLRELSDAHAATVMLGRTLLQPATPITFGLKAAVWHSIVSDGWLRLDRAFGDASTVQLGGATGTRAAFGDKARGIAAALAEELGLALSPPWHTDRGRIGAVAAACAIFAGGLAKIARDVALLMQVEVGEVLARGGGSSTMPHKHNPSGCAVTLAAASRVAGVATGFMTGLVQEHERALGGWQLEWSALSDIVQATGAALAGVASTIEGLQVFPDRMRANLDATNGVVVAERASLLLRAAVGREKADRMVENALAATSRATPFPHALRANAEAAAALGAATLDALSSTDYYIDAAETVRRDLLRSA